MQLRPDQRISHILVAAVVITAALILIASSMNWAHGQFLQSQISIQPIRQPNARTWKDSSGYLWSTPASAFNSPAVVVFDRDPRCPTCSTARVRFAQSMGIESLAVGKCYRRVPPSLLGGVDFLDTPCPEELDDE